MLLLITIGEGHRFEGRGKGAQGVDVLGVGERAKAGVLLAEVMEAQCFKLHRGGIEATIHIVNVAVRGRGPEAFGDSGRAGPEAGVDAFGVDVLGPHADLTAQDHGLLGGGKGRVGGNGVDKKVLARGLHGVQVVARGEQALVALFRACAE